MPNLLNINNYHYRRGGSDVVYLDHAALFEKRGWDTAFFSMKHPKNIETYWNKYFIEEIEVGGNYSPLEKISMASKVVFSFESQKKLKNLLSDFQADIAHLHCIYHHISPSIISTLYDSNVPIVMTAHDLKIACPAYKMLNDTGICEKCKGGDFVNLLRHRCVRGSTAASTVVWVESQLHRMLNTYKGKLSKVVVPSQFFLEKFVEWGWPREKFAYIPNYVDASNFNPLFDAGNYFLYFGRLASEKGVGTLIQAAKIANVPLKIVGTGPLEAELRSMHFALGGDVEFLGYKSGLELHELVRQSRAVVLPSEWYENAPMSILESAALGTPVLAAKIGGNPELIFENETGWTFQSGDVEDLARLLATVMKIPKSTLAMMGRAARDLVVNKFNEKRYLDATLALYADLGVRV